MSKRQGSIRERRVILLLALILVAGMAIRVWYLDSRLNGGRFWDERFSFANVLELHETGSLRPANGYYPLLSYLPQALLLSASDGLHRLTGAGWLEVHDGERFSAHAYRLSRLVQAIWGVAAIWLVFLVGRRLFSADVGLVAALALAFSPWHINASAIFKPDAPLVLAVLVAFYWSLDAARRPTAGRYALAGGGIALAMSSKLTGGLAALPLVFVSAWRCRRQPRRIALLILAAAVALALFLLLNPYWTLYFDYLERLSAEYRWKAEARDLTRWQTPLLLGGFLYRSLGAIGAGAAAIAVVALVVLLARKRFDSETGTGVALLLSFPPAYVAAHMAKTAQFKANNFLPILPFVALVAAWGLVAAGRRLARHLPLRNGRPAPLGIGMAALVAVFVPLGVTYVYRSLTPSAEDLALRFVARRLNDHPACQVVYERGSTRWPSWEGANPFDTCLLRPVDRLEELTGAQLRLTDGVLFPQPRLTGSTAPHYLEAIAASDAELTAVVRRRRFSVRGPGFVAALFRWAPIERQQALDLRTRVEGRFRLEASMPGVVQAGDVVSFSVWMPRGALADTLSPPQLRMGSHIVDLIASGRDSRGVTFVSPRLVSRQPAPNVRLNRNQLSYRADEIRISLWRWQRLDAGSPSRLPRGKATAENPAPPGSGDGAPVRATPPAR